MRITFFVFLNIVLILIPSLHCHEPTSKIDIGKVSALLTEEIKKAIRSSEGDLFTVETGELALFFDPSLYLYAGLDRSLSTMVFSRKIHVSSTYEALEIHRKVCEELLPKINGIRSLRPYLAEFPLTPRSFSLNVCFGPKGREHSSPPYFESLVIRYIPYDPTLYLTLIQFKIRSPTKSFTEVFRIPLESVSGLKPLFNPYVKRGPGPKNPWLFANMPPKDPAKEVKVVFQFIPKFPKQNNLHFITRGYVGNKHYSESAFGFAFAGTHELLLPEARKFAAQCALQFLQHIQNTEDAMKWAIEWKKIMRLPDPESPLNSKDFAFRLSFWDENIDRRESPYIAEIRMNLGKLEYFTSDEGQRLVPVYEETFDEAVAFLENTLEIVKNS